MRPILIIRWLLVAALALPVLVVSLQFISGMLKSMGDELAASFLQRTGTAVSVAWLVVILGLLFAVAWEISSRDDSA